MGRSTTIKNDEELEICDRHRFGFTYTTYPQTSIQNRRKALCRIVLSKLYLFVFLKSPNSLTMYKLFSEHSLAFGKSLGEFSLLVKFLSAWLSAGQSPTTKRIFKLYL